MTPRRAGGIGGTSTVLVREEGGRALAWPVTDRGELQACQGQTVGGNVWAGVRASVRGPSVSSGATELPCRGTWARLPRSLPVGAPPSEGCVAVAFPEVPLCVRQGTPERASPPYLLNRECLQPKVIFIPTSGFRVGPPIRCNVQELKLP